MLGKQFFWIVFFLDMFKSLVPMLIASAIVGSMRDRTALTYALWLGVGVAALLGHVFSVYLKFKGGKGVATSAGVVLGLWPHFTLAGLVAVVAFVLTVVPTRYISLSSIMAAIVFPIAYCCITILSGQPLLGPKWPLLVMALLVSGLIILRHRENMKRLLAGTENKVGQRKAI